MVGFSLFTTIVVRNISNLFQIGCTVKDHAWLHSSIIGWKSTIGRWARMEGVSVLGEDVQIADEVFYIPFCFTRHD